MTTPQACGRVAPAEYKIFEEEVTIRQLIKAKRTVDKLHDDAARTASSVLRIMRRVVRGCDVKNAEKLLGAWGYKGFGMEHERRFVLTGGSSGSNGYERIEWDKGLDKEVAACLDSRIVAIYLRDDHVTVISVLGGQIYVLGSLSFFSSMPQWPIKRVLEYPEQYHYRPATLEIAKIILHYA